MYSITSCKSGYNFSLFVCSREVVTQNASPSLTSIVAVETKSGIHRSKDGLSACVCAYVGEGGGDSYPLSKHVYIPLELNAA